MAKQSETVGLTLLIGRKHRIVGGALCYSLEHNIGTPDAPKWRGATYHSTLAAAVGRAYADRVRTSRADGATELAQRIEEIREEFRRDLAPLLTPPSVG